MREIKFRGYDIDNKCWRYDSGTLFFDIDGIGAEPYYYNIAEESIGQYTGFKDKNGVEIFEGDIIKFERNKELYQIIFLEHAGQWQARRLNENIDYRIFQYGLYECEVVSNIYENKLKEGK